MQGYLIEIPGHELAEMVETANDLLNVAKEDRKRAGEIVSIRERRLHYLEVLLAMEQARQNSLDSPDMEFYVIDSGAGPRALEEPVAKLAGPDALCYARFRDGSQVEQAQE